MTRKLTTLVSSSIAMTLSIIPMFLGTFPVFLNALSSQAGRTAAAFPSLLLLATIAVALGGLAAGWLVDRYGCRWVAIVGILIFGGCLASLSQMDRIGIAVYPLFVLLGVSGSFCGPVVYTKVLSGWYADRRGAALGLVVMAAPMLSSAIMVPLAQALVDHGGWRSAYLEIGIAIAVLGTTVLSFLFWDPPAQQGATPSVGAQSFGVDLLEALSSSSFWILTAAFATSQLVATGISGQMFAISREAGMDRSVAVWALSVMSAAALVGSLTAVFLADKTTTPRAVIACFVPVAVGAALLCLRLESLSFVAACALVGAGNFAAGAAMPYVLSRLFGVRRLGEIFGTFTAMVVTAAGSGPLVFGVAHSAGVSFTRILEMATVDLLLTTLLIIFVRAYPDHQEKR